MDSRTPFLPHFPRLIEGRARLTRACLLGRALDQLRSFALPDVAALVGRFLPEDFFGTTHADARARRERLFGPQTTFWAFLHQVLCPRTPCREIVAKVRAWAASSCAKRQARSAALPSLATGAYCQARVRLPLALILRAFDALKLWFARRAPDAWQWCGRNVLVLDGTGVSMPDTAANQKRWGQPSGQKPGCGFPVAKLLGCFCLSTGAWLGWALGRCMKHDLSLWHQIAHLIKRGDVVVADAGFCAYALMSELHARGVDSVIRLHQARSKDMRRGRHLGKDQRLHIWSKPLRRTSYCPWNAAQWRKLPAELAVRVIRVRVTQRGQRTRELWLATTLTDTARYPAHKLAELYLRRWSIELFFRDIKTTLGMDVLRCKTPALVEKEIALHAVAYNALRAMMLESAASHGRCLGRLSFKGALDVLRQWLPHAAGCFGRPRKLAACIRELSATLAAATNPDRPNRREPRAVKRRPKNHPLLTRPRHKFKDIAHRNNYRKHALN